MNRYGARFDDDLQQSYAVEVQNQYSILSSLQNEDELTADKKYPLYYSSRHTRSLLPKPYQRKTKDDENKVSWEDDRVQARKNLTDAHKQFTETNREQDREVFEEAKRNLPWIKPMTEWRRNIYMKRLQTSSQPPKVCKVGWLGQP